jgi:SAM-dependent methyltransferase
VKRYDEWFAEMWEFVRPALPEGGGKVVEIGCGKFGGFVPRLRAAGYDATGVDPDAPEEPGYERAEFEQYRPPEPLAAIVACTSLHHVADLDAALDHVAASLAPGAPLVIIEMAWERWDEKTIRWCFDRLAPVEDLESDEATWLHRHRAAFAESGQSWDEYNRAWATGEGLHRGERMLTALDARFDRTFYAAGPYCFADLDGVTSADEQAAIDAGQICAVGFRYLAKARAA